MDLILSKPEILITSSTRSISPNISGLQVGICTSTNLLFFFVPKPNLFKILIMSFSFTFIPIVFDTNFVSNFIDFFFNF